MARAAAGPDGLAGASTDHLPLLSALTVQRAVAVTLLGGGGALARLDAWRRGGGAGALLAAGARGGLRVRGGGRAERGARPGPGRSACWPPCASGPSSWRRSPGGDVRLAPLGYDLPFPVTTPAAAARLARTLLPDAAAVGRERLRRRRAATGPGLTGLLRWAAQTQTQALAWGGAPDRVPRARGDVSDEDGASVPASLVALLRGRPAEGFLDGDDWLDRLPGLVRDALQRWDLTPDGTAAARGVRAGAAGAPHHRRGGRPQGRVAAPGGPAGAPGPAAVGRPRRGPPARRRPRRLGDAAGAARPAPGTCTPLPVDEACAVIGELLRQLDRPATPAAGPCRPRCSALVEPWPAHRRASRDGSSSRPLTLATDLVLDEGADGWCTPTCTTPTSWPGSGSRGWPSTPSRWPPSRPTPWHRPCGTAGRRRWPGPTCAARCAAGWRSSASTAASTRTAARAWTIVREVQNARWAASGPGGGARVTVAVAILKAMND